MFRVRCFVTNGAACALLPSVTRRFAGVKTTDPTYEDDRWLEAEFQDVEKTIEERYAFEKQKEVMKKLIAKIRDENDKKLEAKLQAQKVEHHDKHAQEIASLKEAVRDLAKMVNVVKKDK